jgi:hypothetical protein
MKFNMMQDGLGPISQLYTNTPLIEKRDAKGRIMLYPYMESKKKIPNTKNKKFNELKDVVQQIFTTHGGGPNRKWDVLNAAQKVAVSTALATLEKHLSKQMMITGRMPYSQEVVQSVYRYFNMMDDDDDNDEIFENIGYEQMQKQVKGKIQEFVDQYGIAPALNGKKYIKFVNQFLKEKRNSYIDEYSVEEIQKRANNNVYYEDSEGVYPDRNVKIDPQWDYDSEIDRLPIDESIPDLISLTSDQKRDGDARLMVFSKSVKKSDRLTNVKETIEAYHELFVRETPKYNKKFPNLPTQFKDGGKKGSKSAKKGKKSKGKKSKGKKSAMHAMHGKSAKSAKSAKKAKSVKKTKSVKKAKSGKAKKGKKSFKFLCTKSK